MHARSVIRCFEAAAALQRQGRWGEAEQLYQSILVLDQNYFPALHNLGYLRLQQGRREEASRLLNKALKIRPKSAEAQNTLGLVLHTGGQFREAALCFEKALKFDPTHANAHNNLGASLHLLDRHDRAIDCYRRAIALNPRTGISGTRCRWSDRSRTRGVPTRLRSISRHWRRRLISAWAIASGSRKAIHI
jgi:tetratricopeptide (TPR) repeat protein